MGGNIIGDADSKRLAVIAGGPEVDAGEDPGILNFLARQKKSWVDSLSALK